MDIPDSSQEGIDRAGIESVMMCSSKTVGAEARAKD